MIGMALAGFLSGVISGMGIGGGTVLIPALMFLQDMTQQQAQSINLIYFIPTAVGALVLHNKSDNLEKSVLKPIILFGLVGAVAGALIAVNLDSTVLKKIFGGFLLVMGVVEIFKKK